ncbi:MAG: thiosulfate reductase cytochrome subunit (rane anchoring protein) [Edaphobacter sp.]|nr:thiosulfate reductase cytochrome subunit (rane anchoring protein) [Edaphobacter sp.]
MPENPKKPMDGGGPIEPAKPVKPIARLADETVENAPKGSPVAANEPATKDVVADTAMVAPVAVLPEPTAVMAAPEGETKRPVTAATIRLERKHPLAIRWMHWVNFPVLFTMIWSGLLIYWNDSDNAYQHPHAVYRVGVGSLTLVRLFPPWFWKVINAPYRVTEGLGYHFFFMWLFAINGILYVAYLLISGEWRLLVPERRSIRDAIQVTLVDLHLRKGLPPQKKYNGAQRIAYSAVILMGLGSLVTGLSIYKPTQVHWVTTLLGGYEMARWEHFWLTMALCAFFVVHVVQVVLAGWNNFRSMVSGYEIVPATKASLEEERSAR